MTSAEPLLMFVVRCSLFVYVCICFFHSRLRLDVYLLFRWAHFAHDYLCKNTSMWFLPSAATLNPFFAHFLSSSSAHFTSWSFLIHSFFESETEVLLLTLFFLSPSTTTTSAQSLSVWINYASTSVRMFIFWVDWSEKWIFILNIWKLPEPKGSLFLT